MPTYEYRCEACQKVIYVKMTFNDGEIPPIPRCPDCNRLLQRVFTSIPFIFRQGGSGARSAG